MYLCLRQPDSWEYMRRWKLETLLDAINGHLTLKGITTLRTLRHIRADLPKDLERQFNSNLKKFRNDFHQERMGQYDAKSYDFGISSNIRLEVSLSHVWLFATHEFQAPLSVEFSRQENWSG